MGDSEKSNERSAPPDKFTVKDLIKLVGYSVETKELAEWTGKDPRTIRKCLADLGWKESFPGIYIFTRQELTDLFYRLKRIEPNPLPQHAPATTEPKQTAGAQVSGPSKANGRKPSKKNFEHGLWVFENLKNIQPSQ
jgi:hypothetical protein